MNAQKAERSALLRSFVSALALSALGAAPVAAQQQGAAETVLKASHGDWEVRCVEGTQTCAATQMLANPDGQPLIDVEVVSVEGNEEAEALMRFLAPLGVLLPRGLQMRIDGGEPIQTPFLVCTQQACLAQIGLGTQGVNTLKRGAAAQVTVYSAQRPEEPVQATLSLMGFTRSYDDLR